MGKVTIYKIVQQKTKQPCSSVKVPVNLQSSSLESTCSSWKVPAEPGKSGSNGAASRLESSWKSKSPKGKDEIVECVSKQPGLDKVPLSAEVIMGKSSSSEDSDCRRITRSSTSLGWRLLSVRGKLEMQLETLILWSGNGSMFAGCLVAQLLSVSVKGHCYLFATRTMCQEFFVSYYMWAIWRFYGEECQLWRQLQPGCLVDQNYRSWWITSVLWNCWRWRITLLLTKFNGKLCLLYVTFTVGLSPRLFVCILPIPWPYWYTGKWWYFSVLTWRN